MVDDDDGFADAVTRQPTPLEGEGTVIGKVAPDFVLQDQNGVNVRLSDACARGPVMLAFYPRDFTLVCTKQLCNYRDNMSSFAGFGLQIFGISSNEGASHQKFGEAYKFPFPLLSDTDRSVGKRFDCTSLLMAGRVSRAVFIINRNRIILYRYVEPTVLTRRSATELVAVLRDLKKHGLI